MTEPETETETLNRLEAALARIAAHVNAHVNAHAPQAQGNTAASNPVDPSILNALDAMITRLRSALDAPPPAPNQNETR